MGHYEGASFAALDWDGVEYALTPVYREAEDPARARSFAAADCSGHRTEDGRPGRRLAPGRYRLLDGFPGGGTELFSDDLLAV